MSIRRLGTLTALTAAYWVPSAPVLLPGAGSAFGIRTRLPGSTGVLLTFDDGPHPHGTPAVLDVLDKAAAKAVFFLVGEQVRRWPSLAADIAAAGHAIGLHGFRHQSRRQWTARLLRDDLTRASAAIHDATGDTPHLYRPPHGLLSLAGLRQVRAQGLDTLLWSRWGRDWERRATVESITRHLTYEARAGDILLLHDADHYAAPDCWKTTVAALPPILDELARQGLHPERKNTLADSASALC